jgi:(S)-mandelate dehydrogenase
MIFDFIDGGADDEMTLRENRAAWERVRLLPRVARDVSKIDPSAEILGAPAAFPFVLAPTGSAGMAWPGADVALARAAAALGIPCTLSTNATASIEEIAQAAPGRLWFQLYVNATFALQRSGRSEVHFPQALGLHRLKDANAQ